MGAFKKDGLFLKQINSQDTPDSNHVVLYANTDGEIHIVRDDASEDLLASKSYVDTLVSQISSSNNFLNVKDFGAVGDGSTDDTAAIESAWVALTDTSEPYSPPTSSSNFTQQTKALYFPPGTYVYSGSGLTQPPGRTKHWALYGPHSGTVRIDITSNAYFMDISDPRGVLISGLTTSGGKGLLRCNNTGNNVGTITTIQDVQCFDYTECAIGNNADDHPQVIIDRCYFQTKTAYEAIGVAWGGLSDSVKITNSVFFYNKYHIKMGPNMGGSWHIGPNNFFAGETGAGVWIVPRSTSVNIGRGAFISKNKFGNEVQTLTAPRVLIASENTSSGTDRLSYHHSTVANTSGFAGHFTIEDNLFGFDTGYSVGVIQSYVKKVCFNIWDNQIDGTKPPYLIEMAGGITQLHGHYEANQWNIGRLQIIGDGSPATGISLSNVPYMGPIPAPWDESIADVSTVVGYAPEVPVIDNQIAGVNIAGVTALEGPYGTDDAGTFTYTTSGSTVSLRLLNPELGRMFWVDVYLKKSDINPLDSIQVYINRNDSSNRREWGRNINLTDDWQRVVLPVMLREWDGSEAVRLVVKPSDSVLNPGFSDRVDIGWMRLYYARSPIGSTKEGFTYLSDDNITTDSNVSAELILDTELTANRTITLDNDKGIPGQTLRIVRTKDSIGNYSLNVGSVSLWGGRPGGEASDWAEFRHEDGSWKLIRRSVNLGSGLNGPIVYGGLTIRRDGGGNPFFLLQKAGTAFAQFRSSVVDQMEITNATGTIDIASFNASTGVTIENNLPLEIDGGNLVLGSVPVDGILTAASSASSADDKLVTAGFARERYNPKEILPLNAKNYGAIGDGVTDDTSAFSRLFDAVNSSIESEYGTAENNGRAKVYIPSGVYVITQPGVFLKNPGLKVSSLSIEGDGPGSTTIVFKPDVSDIDSYFITNGAAGGTHGWLEVIMQDMWFLYDPSSAGGSGDGSWMNSISAGGPQNYSFRNCLWTGFKYGIHCTGTNNNSEMKFYSCEFERFGTASAGGSGAFLYTETSDQFLNYYFYGCSWFNYDAANWIKAPKGGNFFIHGSNIINSPTSETYVFSLENKVHAYGVQNFSLMASRGELRNEDAKLLYCEWGDGIVVLQSVDYESQISSVSAADTLYFNINDTPGPDVTLSSCMLQGSIGIEYGVNAWEKRSRYRLMGCTLRHYDDPFDGINYYATGGHANEGGKPAVEFIGCRGLGLESTGEGTVGGHTNISRVTQQRAVSLKTAQGRNPVTGGTLSTILPVGAMITKIVFYLEQGALGSVADSDFTMTDGDGTVLAQINSGDLRHGFNIDFDVRHLCLTDNQRTITLTAGAGVNQATSNSLFLIEYV